MENARLSIGGIGVTLTGGASVALAMRLPGMAVFAQPGADGMVVRLDEQVMLPPCRWLYSYDLEVSGVKCRFGVGEDGCHYQVFGDGVVLRHDSREPDSMVCSAVADASLLVPADGTAGECGAVHAGLALQAKGSSYSVQALLGGDAALARRFEGGQFATVYLSPRDYHRVHMPCDGWLTRVVYVPGALMSVAPRVVQAVPGLFARNERVVCVFETAHGPLALVLVGAAIVGSVQLPWQGRVMRAAREAAPQVWDYSAQHMRLVRGQEMGRFLMGSTVVMLWRQPQPLRFEADWRSGARARQGQALANTH